MPIVYTAEHPALAALEVLNAWQRYANLGGYTLYLCTIDPDAVENAVPELRRRGIDPRDAAATREFGARWVSAGAGAVLRVPSVVAPASYNYLLAPDHPDFDAAVGRESLGAFRYDERVAELIRLAKERR